MPHRSSLAPITLLSSKSTYTGCDGASTFIRNVTGTQIKPDMKLTSVIRETEKCKIDVSAMQETRRIRNDWSEYQNESINLVGTPCGTEKLQ